MTDPAVLSVAAGPTGGRAAPALAWASGGAVLLVALFAAGGFLASVSTWGLAASPDSVTYLLGAQSFAEGRWKLASPHFPPLYPMLLAVFSRADGSVLGVAPWFHTVLLAGNIALVGALTWRVTARRGDALAAAALTACSDTFFEAHGWLLSEPLFILWTLVALLLFARAIRLDGAPLRRTLVWAALATGAACVTRYAGLSLLAAGAVTVLLWSGGTRRQRVLRAAGFALLAAAPVLAWIIRNRYSYDTAVNRRVSFIGLRPERLSELGETLERWFVPTWPGRRAFLIAVVAAALVTALAEIARRRATRRPVHPRLGPLGDDAGDVARASRRVLATFAVCYLLLIAVTVLFVDPRTPLDTRILLPVQLTLIIAAVALAGRWTTGRPLLRCVAVAAAGLFIGLQANRTIVIGKKFATNGRGFTARSWAQSPTIRYAATLPPETKLYANTPQPIIIHLDRSAFMLPRLHAQSPADEPDAYERRMHDVAHHLRATDGAVIWFHRTSSATVFEPEQQFVRKLGLIRVAGLRDGAVYRPIPSTSPAQEPPPR